MAEHNNTDVKLTSDEYSNPNISGASTINKGSDMSTSVISTVKQTAPGGNDFSESMAGDEYVEHCSICAKDNSETVAKKYCKNCQEYMCGSCSDYHRRLPVTSAHQMEELSSITIQHIPSAPTSNPVFSATFHGVYDVRTGYETESDISGSCILPDGVLLITDCLNGNLKRLNRSYTVTDVCNVLGKPYAVCVTQPLEAAVTLLDEKKIQFVSLGQTMALTKSFSVGEHCHGLAHNNGELFVSCAGGWNEAPGHVRIYNLEGQLLRTFQTDKTGNQLFSLPFHIVTSVDGSKLHVADKELGLITLDRQGNTLARFSDPGLKMTHGVCTADYGQMLVCGYCSHNVIQVSSSYQMTGVLLDQSKAAYYPQSLIHDHANSRLIVTMSAKNIAVYVLTWN